MAFGSDDKITIRLEVDASGAVRILNDVGKELDKIEDKSKRAGSAVDKFAGAAGGVLAVGAAFKTVQIAANAMQDVLLKGGAIESVTKAFDNLALKAGTAGDAMLNSMSKAVDGTVSKVNLMRQANQLMLAEIDPSKFAVVEQAAQSYADSVGGDSTKATNDFISALVKGNDSLLKQKGYIIDNNKAYIEFGKTLGLSAKESLRVLNEEGKAAAMRAAMIKELERHQAEFGATQSQAKTQAEKFTAEIENQRDEFAKNLAQSPAVIAFITDFQNGLVVLNGFLLDSISLLADFAAKLGNVIATGRTGGKGWFDDFINSASDGLVILGILPKRADSFKKAAEEMSSGVSGAWDPIIKKTGEAAGRYIDTAKAQELAGQAAAKLTAEMEAHVKAVNQVVGSTDEYKKITEQVRLKVISQDEAGRKLVDLYKRADSAVTEYNEAQKDLIDAQVRASQGMNVQASELARLQTRLLSAKTAMDGLGNETSEFSKKLSQNIADGVASLAEAMQTGKFSDAITDIAGNLGATIGEEMGKNFAPELSSILKDVIGPELGEELGASLAAPLGAAIGSAAAGAITQALAGLGKTTGSTVGGLATIGGAIIGNSLLPGGGGAILGALGGQMIGGLVGSLFGDDAKTKARKAADKFFADLFDKRRISVIINGEIKEIRDLVFKGNQSGGLFEGLAGSVKQQFNDLGDALANSLGLAEAESLNLGAVLANNVGGSLIGLQQVILATGQSFEQLAGGIIQSMEAGSISIVQAQQDLQSLADMMTGGIPGAVGAVDQAFKGMMDAFGKGAKGQQLLIFYMQAVGKEAKELGVNTFPQLANMLVSTFGFSAQAVKAFMDAMAAAGIHSLAELANATKETMVAIAANFNQLMEGKPASFKPVNIPTPSMGGGGGGGGIPSAPAAPKQNAVDSKQLIEIVNGSAKYATIMQQLAEHTISAARAQNQINSLYKQADNQLKTLNAAQDELSKAIAKHDYSKVQKLQKTISEIETSINKLASASLADISKPVTDIASAIDKLMAGGKFPNFVNNYIKGFKGDLNQLLVISDRLGVSLKEMSDAAVDSFVRGQTSITQANQALDQLAPGIPGSTSALQALQNLQRYGTKGGALSIDAFKDIFAQAAKTGAKSFNDVISKLMGEGADYKQVQELFQAIGALGIKNFDEVANASDQTVIRILGQLQKLDFPFKETSTEIEKLLKKFDAVKDKTVKINLKVNTTFNTVADKKLYEQIYGTNTPGLKLGAKRAA